MDDSNVNAASRFFEDCSNITNKNPFENNESSESRSAVTKSIYSSCDVDNNNSVCTSKLIDFIAPFMNGHSSLLVLKNHLDPNNKDQIVDFDSFSNAFTKWVSEMYKPLISNNSSCNMELNSKDCSTSSLDKSNDNMFSATTGDVHSDPLQEQLKPLNFQNQQLTKELDALRLQLATCEEENNDLLKENTNVTNQLFKEQQLCTELKCYKKDSEEFVEANLSGQKKIFELEKSLVLTQKENASLHSSITEHENQRNKLENDIHYLKNILDEKDEALHQLKHEVNLNEEKVITLTDVNLQLENRLQEQKEILNHYIEENAYLIKEKSQQQRCAPLHPAPVNQSTCTSDYHTSGNPISINTTQHTPTNSLPITNNPLLNNGRLIHFLNDVSPSSPSLKSNKSRKTNNKQSTFNLYRSVNNSSDEDINLPPLRRPRSYENNSIYAHDQKFLKLLNIAENPDMLNKNNTLSCVTDGIDDQSLKSPSTKSSTHISLDREMFQANLLTKIQDHENTIAQLKQDIAQFYALNANLVENEKLVDFLQVKITGLETDNNLKFIRIVELMEQKETLVKQLELEMKLKSSTINNEDIHTKLEQVSGTNSELELENQDSYETIFESTKSQSIETNLEQLSKTLSFELNDKSEKSFTFVQMSISADNNEKTEIIDCNDENINEPEQRNHILHSLMKKDQKVKILETMVNYQNIELETLVSDKNRHIKTIYELKCNVDKFTKHNEDLLLQVEELQKQTKSLSGEVKFLNELNESLQLDLEQVNNNYDKFQETCCPIEDYDRIINEKTLIIVERDRLVEDNKTLKFDHEKLQDQIMEIVGQSNEFSTSTREMRLQLQNFRDDVKALKTKIYKQQLKRDKQLENEFNKKINELENTNKTLQFEHNNVLGEFETIKVNYENLIKESEKWNVEKMELQSTTDKFAFSLNEALIDKQTMETQLNKRSQTVCQWCLKLHKDNEELQSHISNLQREVGLLEADLYLPKKGNTDKVELQLETLKANFQITDDLLKHEKQNSERFKQQNTKLIFELNELRTNTVQEKLTLDNKHMETINKLRIEKEELEKEKSALIYAKNDLETKYGGQMELAKKDKAELQKKVTDLFNENQNLEKKLGEVLQELEQKTDMCLKLQADVEEEKVLLELFHQKSILFQQNIESLHNEKGNLQRKLSKAVNNLQKSETKYLSIRKVLVDCQCHVSGDFKDVQITDDKDVKITNLEMTLQTCQEELSRFKKKFASSIACLSSLSERITNVTVIVVENRERLKRSILTLVSSWKEMLEKVMDIQLILDGFANNDTENCDELDQLILKLQNEIQLTAQFFNALSTIKFSLMMNQSAEPVIFPHHRFVKKLTLTSTSTTVQRINSAEEMLNCDKKFGSSCKRPMSACLEKTTKINSDIDNTEVTQQPRLPILRIKR